MNSHYYASRFGKSGGGFKKETVEKLTLVIEAESNGSDLILSSYGIDTSEMSYGARKLFFKIEYGVL